MLVDIASTLPVAFRLDKATADERRALLDLLGDLFRAWPDAPVETISGDSLFEHSKHLATHLVFGWGIQPIFPERKGEFDRDRRYVDTLGVPRCACGEMKVRNREGFYDVARRRKHGFRPGELLDKGRQRGARIRWRCPSGRCKDVTTRPEEDPRLYTYYPRAGRDRLAVMRRVLSSRREAAESVFAALKRRGCGASGFDRPAWVYDDEACDLPRPRYVTGVDGRWRGRTKNPQEIARKSRPDAPGLQWRVPRLGQAVFAWFRRPSVANL